MWNIIKKPWIEFFLEAKFSFTGYSPNLFQIMAKKDKDRNFNSSSVKSNVNIKNWRKAYKNSC